MKLPETRKEASSNLMIKKLLMQLKVNLGKKRNGKKNSTILLNEIDSPPPKKEFYYQQS